MQQLRQSTMPIHLQAIGQAIEQSIEDAILRDHYSTQEESEQDLEIEQQVVDLPTIGEHPAVHVVHAPIPAQFVQQPQRVVPPPLPLDNLGRPYWRVDDKPLEPTSALIEAAVQHYYELMQDSPSAIILPKSRYIPFGLMLSHSGYCHYGTMRYIPVRCDERAEFDIVCHGEVLVHGRSVRNEL